MKKLITLVLAIIIAMSTTMPIMAKEVEEPEETSIFEKDLSVCKEGSLSVYRRNIRENIKGEWANCDCWDLCFCTSLYHVLEDTTEDDFYSAFFYGDYFVYPLGGIYQDCSSSMEETFCYEKSNIIKNLSPFMNEKEKDIEYVFKNKKTNLYGLLSSFDNTNICGRIVTMPREIPIIITDLWDTEGAEEESFKYDGEIIFCVPYASTNKEGVLHCEEFINNLLWNHIWIPESMSIYVVYTDEVIVKYSNGSYNCLDGYVEIYVP